MAGHSLGSLAFDRLGGEAIAVSAWLASYAAVGPPGNTFNQVARCGSAAALTPSLPRPRHCARVLIRLVLFLDSYFDNVQLDNIEQVAMYVNPTRHTDAQMLPQLSDVYATLKLRAVEKRDSLGQIAKRQCESDSSANM